MCSRPSPSLRGLLAVLLLGGFTGASWARAKEPATEPPPPGTNERPGRAASPDAIDPPPSPARLQRLHQLRELRAHMRQAGIQESDPGYRRIEAMIELEETTPSRAGQQQQQGEDGPQPGVSQTEALSLQNELLKARLFEEQKAKEKIYNQLLSNRAMAESDRSRAEAQVKYLEATVKHQQVQIERMQNELRQRGADPAAERTRNDAPRADGLIERIEALEKKVNQLIERREVPDRRTGPPRTH